MKTSSKFVVVALAVVSAFAVQAKALKVLMIGNSFSVCVLKEMPKVSAEAGDTLDLASLMIGGCPLSKHWTNMVRSAEADFKPYGFSWNYASVKNQKDAPIAKLGHRTNIAQALAADSWDVITIQQASGQSAFYDTYQPYADNLIAKLRELAPKAEIVIQETWSYSPYDGRLAGWKMTPADMHAALKKAYRQLADKHHLRIIPTGDAVQIYRGLLPVAYDKVYTRQEIAAFKEPQVLDFHGDVAGASFWGKGYRGRKDADEHKFRVDGAHLNSKGHFLQALVWQAKLFGTDVTKLAYRPACVSEAEAVKMRQAAMQAVKGN